MAYKKVTRKYKAVFTKKTAHGKNIRTLGGVAQEFEGGTIHLVLNALPLGQDVWLEPAEESSFSSSEEIPDPAE